MQKVCSKVCSGAYSKPDNGLTKYQWSQVIAHGFAALQDMGEFAVDFCDLQRMGTTRQYSMPCINAGKCFIVKRMNAC